MMTWYMIMLIFVVMCREGRLRHFYVNELEFDWLRYICEVGIGTTDVQNLFGQLVVGMGKFMTTPVLFQLHTNFLLASCNNILCLESLGACKGRETGLPNEFLTSFGVW